MNKNNRNLLVYLLVFILIFQQVIQGFAAMNVRDDGMADMSGKDLTGVYQAEPSLNPTMTNTPIPISTPTSTVPENSAAVQTSTTMIASPTPVITIFYSSAPTGVSTASPSNEEIPTLTSNETPIPTETLLVTHTPIPTESSVATHTPISTETSIATHTPIPTEIPDVKVLPKPDGLSLEIIDNSSVKLSWNKVKTDTEVKGYDIYRNDTKIGTTDASEYTDNGLAIGTSYNYYIKACDVSDNVSLASDSLLLVLGTTTINSDVVLNENRVYQSINLTSGKLDLTGHSLYVYGNLNQTGGTVYIDGGRLEVSGNYAIKNPSYYTYASLTMTNEADYVKVGGGFTQHSYYSHEGLLTAGTMEVKGDFIQDVNSSYSGHSANFKATGTHKVILTGISQQKIRFDSPASSWFVDLENKNTSGSPLIVTGGFSISGKFTNNGYGFGASLNVGSTNWKLTGDEVIEGDLNVSGSTVDLNGKVLRVKGNLNQSGGTIDLKGGSLLVEGNSETNSSGKYTQTGGTMYIDGGRLEVSGDYVMKNPSYYTYADLRMTNESDYVKVGGSFTQHSYYSHEGLLTAGTMEVKGDFIQDVNSSYSGHSANFNATGTHKVILTGTSQQKIRFDSPGSSWFADLDNKNTSGSPLIVTGGLSVNGKFVNNRSGFGASLNVGSTNWKLTGDEVINGDLNISGSTIDLNGKILRVKGNLTQTGGNIDLKGGSLLVEGNSETNSKGNYTQTGGTMYIDQGRLEVSGDYVIKNPSYYTYANLKMTNEEDYVKVGGSFTQHSYYSHEGLLTAGTMEVKGDFIQDVNSSYAGHSANFNATGTHKVILTGTSQQKIRFDSPASSWFADLEYKNTSGSPLIFSGTFNVCGEFVNNGSGLAGLNVGSTNWTLTGDEVIYGDLNISGSTLDLNGKVLKVNGNLTQTGGTMYIDGGRLEVSGDYVIKNPSYYTYANLKMTNEEDYVKVGGSFTQHSYYSHEGLLTAGTMEVKGDFIQDVNSSYSGNSANFNATGTHLVILNGTSMQNIKFDSPAQSYFNKLKIIRSVNNGYKFNTTPVWKELEIYDDELPSTPDNLKISRKTVSSISLSWSPSYDNVGIKNYEIYRDDKKIGESLSPEYVDNTIEFNKNYKYKVRALDENGFFSDFSSIINAAVTDKEAPSKPDNLKLVSKTFTSIKFTWTPSKDNVETVCYEVYRDGAMIGIVEVNEFEDIDLLPGEKHSYYVYALDETNNRSEASSIYTEISKVDDEAPSIPQGLKLVSRNDISSSIIWSPSTDNFKVAGYEVYRDGVKIKDITDADTTKFEDSGLTKMTSYTYTVKAYDFSGNFSEESDPLIFTTAPATVTISTNAVSEQDELYGTVYLTGGIWDLNGKTITIDGDLIQSGGTLYVNGGQLKILGNYSIKGSSYLKMINDADYVLIDKNFLMQSDNIIKDNYINAGTIEVKGDFLQRAGVFYNYGTYPRTDNFVPGGTHKVVLSGTNIQKIDFQYPGSSYFNVLELKNTSEQGVQFINNISLKSLIKHDSKITQSSVGSMNWTLNEDVELDSSLYISGSTVDLNGYKLTVNGDLIQSGGILYVNGGQLVVNGNYYIQSETKAADGTLSYGRSTGIIKMQNSNDYVKVNGSFQVQSDNIINDTLLSAGTLEVKGDFVQIAGVFYNYGTYARANNFAPGGTHKVILSGDKKQKVYFQYPADSYFNILELKNTSKQGIVFENSINVKSLIRNDSIISKISMGAMNWTLNEDTVLDSSLYINNNTLDLNGYSLTINGDLIQSAGVLYVNGGKLTVNGSYFIQSEIKATDGTLSYGRSTGIIKMQNPDDYIKVTGSFQIQSDNIINNTLLNAGTLEVKGDFVQKAGEYYYYGTYAMSTVWYKVIRSRTNNFAPGGTHKVVLSGIGVQKIEFQNPADSYFNILEIKNKQGENIKFANSINVISLYTNSAKLQSIKISSKDLKLSEDMFVDGTLYLSASTLDLNGYKLTVNGNLVQSGGVLNINGGELTVKGDYRIQSESKGEDDTIVYGRSSGNLKMLNDDDYILVTGSFYTQSDNEHKGALLNAGTIEVKGDFVQRPGQYYYYGNYDRKNNFAPEGTHRVILSGTDSQKVDFQNSGDSYFNVLEIKNTSEVGVQFIKSLNVKSLIRNDSKISKFSVSSMNWSLIEDTVIDCSLYFSGATIDLNGHKLTVNGDLIQSGGTMYINGGQLYINGDYRIQAESTSEDGALVYGRSAGLLKMINPDDYIKVSGSFFIQSDNVISNEILNEGVIEIKGDIVQKPGQYYYYGTYDRKNNFAPGGNHKVILSGSDVQNINFQDSVESYFNILELKNYSKGGIIFGSSFNAKTFISNNCNIAMKSIGSMDWKLSQDAVINGDVYLSGSTLDLNGHKLTINGNLIQSNGVLSVNGGSLIINGDYRIQTENKASDGTTTYAKGNGLLKMLNAHDYVLVNGSFYIQSGDVNGSSVLSAGVLEVKGDFIQLAGQYYYYGTYDRSNNFTPGGSHKVVLSGSSVQNVNFQYPNDSYINILQITKPIETGYTFNKTPIWKELVYDVEAPSIPLELKTTSVSEISISLSWEASTDNDSVAGYEIYRDGSLASYVKNTEFTDVGLTPGKEYVYKIRAVDAGHNVSEFSHEIAVSTLTDTEKPSKPGNLSAYFIDTDVYLSWTASTDNVEVARYDIYRDGEFIASTLSTEYKDTELKLNKKYSYKVKAYDAAGNWAESAVEITLSDDHSNDMVDATEIEIGEDAAGTINYRGDIDWFKFTTTNAGYYTITGKGVTDLLGNVYNGDGTLKFTGENSGDRFTITGTFEADTEYYIRIKYSSSFSTGIYTFKVSELDNEPPVVPTGLVAIKKTPVSISLKWDAATDNTEVAGYKLYRDGVLIKDTTSTEFTDTGLDPETSYTYTVRAYDNLKNLSIESDALEETTEKDIDAPSIPTGLKMTSVIRSQDDTGKKVTVKLVWSASTDNVKVAGYEIYRDGVSIGTSDKYEYIDSDAIITESNIYKYTVKAFDTSKNYSADSVAVTFDNEPPTAPAELKEIGKTEKSVVLSWKPSTDSIGIAGYEVYRDGIKVGTSTTNSYTANGLEPDKTYIFKVCAFDAQGNISDSGNEITVTTTIDTEEPSTPGKLRLVSKTDTTVTIAWDASTDNVALRGYEILKDGVSVGTTVAASYKIEGLVPGTEYKFTVKAFDTSNNVSDESDVFCAVPRLPSEPSNLEVVEKPYSVVLSWSNTDSDVTGYKVYKGSSEEDLKFWTNCNSNNIELTGLNGGTTVYFKVSSVDKWGNESIKSAAISGTTLIDSNAPSVSSFEPQDNYRSSGKIILKVSGTDNYTLDKFIFDSTA
ncbi:MAG TPA: fibronectin type III domain-containing protein [Pseudobacteroides sp.]|nr:fibronectin type III domain-containing protein [Pseudobacteroides sp.]